MTIDDVIQKLQEFKKEHGNIQVIVAKGDEYWGTVYNEVSEHTLRVDERTTLNPKKLEDTTAVVFCAGYDI